MTIADKIAVLESAEAELSGFIDNMRALAAKRHKVEKDMLILLDITEDSKRGRMVWFNVNNPGGWKDKSTILQPELWSFRKAKEFIGTEEVK